MGILATGQITFIDYNDALSLAGFIGSTQLKTQVYSKDNGGTFYPSWVGTNNLLTVNLFKQATGAAGIDLLATSEGNGIGISNVKWKLKLYQDAEVEIVPGGSNVTYGSVGAAAPFRLTLNKNVMTEAKPGLVCTFSCTYTDPSTSLSIDFKTTETFSLIKTGGKAVVVQIQEANGSYVIRNGAVASTTLTLKFNVYRNGVRDALLTGSAQWKYKDPAGALTNDGSAVALSGSDTNSVATKVIAAATIEAIKNSRLYRIEFTDNDSEAETAGVVYSDEVTILDLTDPYVVECTISGGNIFKNGEGTKTVYPRLFQNGGEIDLVSGSYKLYRFGLTDQNGVITYFKSAYDLATTISGALTVGLTSLSVVSAGTGAKAIKAGDRLVMEPGVGGKEELVEVGSAYTTGTVIPLKTAVTIAHASGVAIKSANKKTGLTDTVRLITVTGDDINSLGAVSIEVIG